MDPEGLRLGSQQPSRRRWRYPDVREAPKVRTGPGLQQQAEAPHRLSSAQKDCVESSSLRVVGLFTSSAELLSGRERIQGPRLSRDCHLSQVLTRFEERGTLTLDGHVQQRSRESTGAGVLWYLW